MIKRVVITGASGFVGQKLTSMFRSQNFEVIAIKKSDLKDSKKLTSIVNEADLVINLAGANIINRWSASYKKLLYSSRIDTTKAIVEAMKNSLIKPKLFISTSAIGIYKNDIVYDETTQDLSEDFLGNLCKDWEAEALKAKESNIRTAIFRFGIVMGDGGAIAKMLMPFKLGIGGTIGDGSQAFSFVHIDDLLNVYNFLLENEKLDGVFNLTAPIPTTNYGLTKALGKSLNRPTILAIPQFVLNLILSEGAKILTDGQSVVPNHLLKSGFKFKFENIEDTIENIV